jgi:hypothetical protein
VFLIILQETLPDTFIYKVSGKVSCRFMKAMPLVIPPTAHFLNTAIFFVILMVNIPIQNDTYTVINTCRVFHYSDLQPSDGQNM